MSQQLRKRPFEKISIATTMPAGILMEFLVLCAGGRILNEANFEVFDKKYRIESDPEKTTSIYPDEQVQQTGDRDIIACASIYLGAKLLQASVEVEGTWSPQLPSDQYLNKEFSPLPVITDPKDRLCPYSSLRLEDLKEIHRLLTESPKIASSLEVDDKFRAVFPGMESRWGEYGFLRHRSGTEIKTRWEGEHLLSHALESPNPIEHLLERWMNFKGLKRSSDFRRSYLEKKWNLARLLERVPTEHQRRVYQWVTSTTHELEKATENPYEADLPESFECEFENSILTVNRNLDFELIEF